MTWRARASAGVPLGLAFIAAVLTVDVFLVHQVVTLVALLQISFAVFFLGLVVLLSLPFLVVIGYHTLSCLTLRYALDRNGLVVRWLGSAQVVPIRDVQRIIPGSRLGGIVVGRRGVRWPGHVRGVGVVPGIGRTRFLATQGLPGELLLIVPGPAVAISPADPDGFLDAFTSRQSLGPNRLLEPEVRRARWLSWDLWTNRNVWVLVGAAVAINLILFGYLCARFPNLDAQLPLHFNSLGQADRIADKVELFALPIIGLIILGTNLVLGLVLYRRERAGSYLLWGAAAAAQVLFWLATFSIV